MMTACAERVLVLAVGAERGADRWLAADGGRPVASDLHGILVVFDDVRKALVACQAVLRADRAPPLPRMAVHVGPCREDADGRLDGPAVHLVARVAAVAGQGQVLITEPCWRGMGGAAHLVVRDLGGWRLPGVRGLTRLYQALGADLDRDAESFLDGGDGASALVGREADLRGIAELVELGARLVSICGPGGSGRRVVADAVGAVLRAAPRAREVLGVEAGQGDAPALVRGVAVALDLPLGAGATLAVAAEQIGRMLAARGPCVLTVDHVDREVGTILAVWLCSAPDLRIICVVDAPFGVPGEVAFTLGPVQLGDRGGRQPAFELLAARASDLGVELRPDEATQRLVERVAGHPLALALVASLLPVAGAEELVARMGETATLDRILEEIWVRLPGAGREAVERGAALPCPLPVSHFAAAVDAPVDVVEGLVHRGILQTVSAWAVPNVRRVALHPAVAQIWRSRTDSDAREIVRIRLADAVLADAEEALGMVDGPHASSAVARLLGDQEALLWIARAEVDDARAARAVLALQPLFARYGVVEANRPLLDRLIEVLPEDEVLARMLLARARVLRESGRPGDALVDLERVRTLTAGGADPAIVGRMYVEAGACLGASGARNSMTDALDKAVVALQTVGDAIAEADGLVRLGDARWHAGDGAGAEHALRDGLVKARALGARAVESQALASMGDIRVAGGSQAEAQQCFREAIRLAQETGDRRHEASVLVRLAQIDLVAGEAGDAAEHLDAALALAREAGDQRIEARALMLRGQSLLADARREDARRALLGSLAILRALRDGTGEGLAMGYLGVSQHLSGNQGAARDYYERAVRMLEDGPRGPAALFAAWLGVLEVEEGEVERARGLFERATNAARRDCPPYDRAVGLLRGVLFLHEAEHGSGPSLSAVRQRLVPALVAVNRRHVDVRPVVDRVQRALEQAPL
jgi:tetratricopeptide (TPR) repeat protein